MRKKMLKNASFLVIVAVFLSFVTASLVMYEKVRDAVKSSIRDEAEYVRTLMEAARETGASGDVYLVSTVGQTTANRITLVDSAGKVLYDSEEDPETMENHASRPEFIEARENGSCEMVRYSETLSRQTFYYAVRLDNGEILRVARTTDSVFKTLFSGTLILGVVLLLVLLFTIYIITVQTNKIMEPINELDLEHPLNNVIYEEMRPLLGRLDEQNRQIARQMEELKEAGEVRREFSANVSHELKTPLMSISGYAEIMENGLVRPEDIPEFAGRIHHEATRLKTLVEDIIELSKLDENSGKLPFETVDIGEMSREVLKNLEHQAEKKKINLIFIGEDTRNIRGVYRLLYEIFYNLADNAVKYTGECGRVQVDLRETPVGIVWSVEDNGIGIAKEDQERIFERFYRVDKSHSRGTGGTGLGLSIVKHAALVHQAKIRVESEVGKGTKITVVFQKEN